MGKGRHPLLVADCQPAPVPAIELLEAGYRSELVYYAYYQECVQLLQAEGEGRLREWRDRNEAAYQMHSSEEGRQLMLIAALADPAIAALTERWEALGRDADVRLVDSGTAADFEADRLLHRYYHPRREPPQDISVLGRTPLQRLIADARKERSLNCYSAALQADEAWKAEAAAVVGTFVLELSRKAAYSYPVYYDLPNRPPFRPAPPPPLLRGKVEKPKKGAVHAPFKRWIAECVDYLVYNADADPLQVPGDLLAEAGRRHVDVHGHHLHYWGVDWNWSITDRTVRTYYKKLLQAQGRYSAFSY